MSFSDISDTLSSVIKRAEKANPVKQGDYKQDGLIYCGKCHTPKQARISIDNIMRIVPASCECDSEAFKKEELRRKKIEWFEQTKTLRIFEINDRVLSKMTFDMDNGSNPVIMRRAHDYVDSWEDAVSKNVGLIFWGNTGTGKTFVAACIANALRAKHVPVLITSFPLLVSMISGLAPDERVSYINSMGAFDLLMLDDLGAERDSSFAREQVYNIIETRSKQNKPTIITTNLTIAEMGAPEKTPGIKPAEIMDLQRIYQRILGGMCVPVSFKGGNLRDSIAEEKMEAARKMFGD